MPRRASRTGASVRAYRNAREIPAVAARYEVQQALPRRIAPARLAIHGTLRDSLDVTPSASLRRMSRADQLVP